MERASRFWDDARVAAAISRVLRIGVTLASAVAVLGGVFFLVKHGREPFDFRVFRGEPNDLRTVPSIIADVFAGRSRGTIQLGLLLLIATPVARVAFSIVAFVLQRDRLYVVIAAIVLMILMYSLAGGRQ